MKTFKVTHLILLFSITACNQSTGQTPDQEWVRMYMEKVSSGNTLSDNSLLIGVDGDSTYFHQLKGKWLFLDYWSTSCKPCIKEIPYVKALHAEYQKKGLKVVMINLDKKETKWKRGIRLFNPPAPNYTTNRSIDNAFFALNLVELITEDGKKALSTLMPQYVLISPEGIIVSKKMPKPSDSTFSKTLNQYLNKSSTKLRNP